MNLKLPLPRVPARVTAALDRYSDWAERPVLRRDWASGMGILIVASGYAWWSGGGWIAFGIAVSAGILCWVALEAWRWD
jgi:uncharacterized membrane protein YjjP (DUF1212 family)